MALPAHAVYEQFRPLLDSTLASLRDLDWFDAHTHIGHNDPDGLEADPQDILDGLDAAGHKRALLFPLHEPEGYPAANDAVLEACAQSGDRLTALGRVDPNSAGALAEAERCLAAGAAGIKLHPRSDRFDLGHPVVGEIVARTAAQRGIVLVHAGRGIPNLGEDAITLAAAHPGVRFILAHAGISDLGAIAGRCDDLYFDTSWWQVSDMLALMTQIRPDRILYASDLPYGAAIFTSVLFVRSALAAGHGADAIRAMAGGQLARLVAGEEPIDLGPAIGTGALGPRIPALERVVAHTTGAVTTAFRGGDPIETVAVARLGCQHAAGDPHGALLEACDALLERAQAHHAASNGTAMAVVPGTIMALILAGTPEAGVPAAVV